jgi:hypothetical protein
MSRYLSFLPAACLAASLLGAPALAQTPAAAEQGAWQRHELEFAYMGFTTIYSCDGLAQKLKTLLRLSGARADSKVMEGACGGQFGRPDRLATARLQFYTLVPHGDGESVAGQWHKVRLAPGRPSDLQEGDCELVEQFRDLVLKPTFATRALSDQVRCTPHQVNGSYRLEFEAFGAST